MYLDFTTKCLFVEIKKRSDVPPPFKTFAYGRYIYVQWCLAYIVPNKLYNLFIALQRFQPLFEGKQGVFFSTEGAHRSAQGSREILQTEFLSSGISCILISFLWYSIRFLFLSQMSLGFSLLLLIHPFRIKPGDLFHCFYTMATSKNHE